MKLIFSLALLALSAPAFAADVYEQGPTISTATKTITRNMAGRQKYAASAASIGTTTIDINGATGGISASSATLTATGNAQYSLWTSSGINVAAGGVIATFMRATTFVGNLVGNVTGNLTGNVTGNMTGNVTGNAGTATALAANGANCSSGSFPLGVDASGAVESCTDSATQAELDTHAALTGTSAHGAASANTASAIVARDGSGNFSAGTISAALSGNATTSSALAANGANCSANSYSLGVDASGAAESCGTNISGNSGTATALAANGSNCSAGQYARGVDASGNAENCTVASAGTGLSAWVVFTGTGTVRIEASSGVSSITDNGTGDYTVNFSASFTGPKTYSCTCTIAMNNDFGIHCGATSSAAAPTASAFRLHTRYYTNELVGVNSVFVQCVGN